MKKIFIMSLLALSSVSSFAGNKENPVKNESPKSKTVASEDQTLMQCYHFEVWGQSYINYAPQRPGFLAYEEYGLYASDADADLRNNEIYYLYPSTLKNGTGMSYFQTTPALSSNCSTVLATN